MDIQENRQKQRQAEYQQFRNHLVDLILLNVVLLFFLLSAFTYTSGIWSIFY